MQQETHESNGAQTPQEAALAAAQKRLAQAPCSYRGLVRSLEAEGFSSPTPSTPPTTAGQTGNGRPFSASADVFPSTPFPCGSFWHD